MNLFKESDGSLLTKESSKIARNVLTSDTIWYEKEIIQGESGSAFSSNGNESNDKLNAVLKVWGAGNK